MSINDHTGVPIYANAADAKEKLSPRIKEECERRILSIMPEWRQRNAIADLSSDNAETKQQRQQLGRKSPHFEQSRTRSRRRFFR